MNRTLAKRALLAVLLVEVLVPAAGLVFTSPPRQYSWSMFVESSTIYRYTGTDRAGAQVDLDPAEVGSPWKSIHYGTRTPELLCGLHPELVSVTRFYDGRRESSVPC